MVFLPLAKSVPELSPARPSTRARVLTGCAVLWSQVSTVPEAVPAAGARGGLPGGAEAGLPGRDPEGWLRPSWTSR